MKKLNLFWAFVCLFLSLSPLHAQVVINEIYGGGGNSGAILKNDFIELFNNSSSPVDLTGWSVQYASSTGSTWQKTDLSGIIPGNGYYLVQEAQGSGGTADLPSPDAVGIIVMSGTNGKVALVSSSTLLAGTCPTGIVDLAGYGSSTCYEGTGAAPALSNTTSAQRTPEGADTDNNNTDFTTGTPTPANSTMSGSSLPVIIGDFTVRAEDAGILMEWTTLQESNSKMFLVERSADGSRYVQVGTVEAAGNSALPKQYRFRDSHPEEGLNFYRLKLVDMDESFTYSSVRKIVAWKLTGFRFHPNPAKEKIFISPAGTPGPVNIRLSDLTGRMLISREFTGNQQTLEIGLTGLAKGMYILTLSDRRQKESFMLIIE